MDVDTERDRPGVMERAELRSKHEDLVSQHESLISQHENLASEHQNLLSENQKLANSNQEFEQALKSLQNVAGEKEDLEQSLKKVEQEKTDLEKALRSLQDDLEQSLNPLGNTEQDKSHLEQSLKKVEQEKIDLEKALKSLQDDLEQSLNPLGNTEQDKSCLEQSLKKTEQEKIDLERSLKSLQDDLEKSLKSLHEFAREKDDLEQSLKSLQNIEQEKNNLKMRLKKAEKERKDFKLKNKDLWASKETTESEIQSLRKELDECRGEQEVLKQDCSILEANKIETAKALDEAQTASKAMQESLNAQLEKSKESLQNQRETIKSLESGRQKLEKESTESLERAQRETDRVSADYQAFKEQQTKELEAQREHFQKREVAIKEASDGEIRRLTTSYETLKSDVKTASEQQKLIKADQDSLQAEENSLRELLNSAKESKTESLTDTVADSTKSSLTLRDEPSSATFWRSLPASPTSDGSHPDQEAESESLLKAEEDSIAQGKAAPQQDYFRRGPDLIKGVKWFFERVLKMSESEVQKMREQVFAPGVDHDRKRLVVASATVGRNLEDLELAFSNPEVPKTSKFQFTKKPAALARRFRSRTSRTSAEEETEVRNEGGGDRTIQPQVENQDTVVGASDSATQSGENVVKTVYWDRETQTIHMTDDALASTVTGSEDPKTQDVTIQDAHPKVSENGSHDANENVALNEPLLALIEPAVPAANQGNTEVTYPTGQKTRTGDITTLQLSSAPIEKENHEDLSEVVLGDPDRSGSHGLMSVMMPDGSTKNPRWIQTFQKPLVIFMFAITIMLLAWVGCYGVSARRERNLWLAANDLTRKAVISIRAGGGTGTGVPAWLWNDPLLDSSGRIYEDL
ncbi:MAG: hypothetical protein Q9214_004614 [Letrouitia sp. 1 TL-2023]